ncbi:helix-turn-helix transcriptional regulator, partial [Kitasatospora sp. MBT63]|uniref:helix-turn-helix transcriptional regulator n=1 Tax=Kitasatospora sp. MBT63 TaxID=1444768 RepID=UPI00053B459C
DPPLHRARLEQAAARLHHHLADHTTATPLLHRARQRYTTLGAKPFLDHPDHPDHQPGTHPHHPDNLLTERELDTARMAAKGLTNREIAQQLYLSTKTVEYHLGHVYEKLGITSRRHLR